MNLSLRNRVAFSFIIANVVVIIMGVTVYYFLNSLNKKITEINDTSSRISVVSDEAKISAVSILKMQKKILITKSSEEDLRKLGQLCDNFSLQLQKLESYYTDIDAKKIISKMIGYVDSLKTIVSKTSLFYRDNAGLTTISELTDKILESFSEFQDIQFFHNEQKEKQLNNIIGETRRNMLITLIITFLGTILLSLVIPGKITMPFKKLVDAVRELQDCNFDVTIYYNQNDEIGELSREMNKMIHSIKKFEELRTEKIMLENRKFDTLANLVKKNILLTQATGEILYLNTRLYNLLDMQSDDLLNRSFKDVHFPEPMVETLDMAIKRRSKIDNEEITFPLRTKVMDPETNEYVYKELDQPFHGYATVIPIRAKDSSSDFYMMILSEEVFV